jgi:putative ABC transport system permease protein
LIKTGRETKRAFIIATSDDLDSIENFEVLHGRFINEKDILTGKNVILIDDISAKILFGYEDCTGKTVKIGSSVSMANATIIGVYRNVGGAFAEAFSDDMPVFVYMPITYAEKIFSNDFNINEIEVSITDSSVSEKAAAGIVRLLETNHHNRGNYKAENMMKQLDKVDKILNIFTAVIGSIAGISLIVGGIGVMNIMLVSVTERTREIGIRKSIGATRKNILIQFLIEAIIIALIGGIIGMMIGILMGFAIGAVLKITPGISILTIITAFLFSSAVGIFFGLYPANKASKLDPIEALRYE